jgi:hypothetical protein
MHRTDVGRDVESLSSYKRLSPKPTLMLTQQQIDDLAERVNEEVDLPIIGENIEKGLLKLALNKIVEVLDRELPQEMKDTINDISKGVEFDGKRDFQELVDNTISFLNKEVNIPLVSDQRENEIFKSVSNALVEALQKNKKL